MVHIDVCNGNHEFIDVVMTQSGYSGVVASWKQCKNCGTFLQGSTKYANTNPRNEVKVYDLSSVAKQRRKEGSL